MMTKKSNVAAAFCAIGLLNNLAYVVMLAGAKSISEGGTAMVFLANIMPGFLVKLSSPYWFDKVSYLNRIRLGSLLMALSFTFVGTFNNLKDNETNDETQQQQQGLNFNVAMQLLGVAFSSAQGDLGEATLLALGGRTDSIMNDTGSNDLQSSQRENDEKRPKSLSITAFASGTGLAGPLGFAFVVIFTNVFEFSLSQTMFVSLVFPVCYLFIFTRYLTEFTSVKLNAANESIEQGFQDDFDALLMNDDRSQEEDGENADNPTMVFDERSASSSSSSLSITDQRRIKQIRDSGSTTLSSDLSLEQNSTSSTQNENVISQKSAWERLKLTASLWRFMIPLFTVYASEYALQSGVWTAIGFPVDDEDARNSFYTNSNWAYQIGVFVSRSSGAFCMAPMWMLWLMPILQCGNLIFFYFVAANQFWYNNFLLIPCFYVGLLGGSVYVNGYMRINNDLPFEIREFALSTVSVADSLGIMIADISGLFIQSCLYKSNNINGSVVSCPV